MPYDLNNSYDMSHGGNQFHSFRFHAGTADTEDLCVRPEFPDFPAQHGTVQFARGLTCADHYFFGHQLKYH
jgi:hypothetical protein